MKYSVEDTAERFKLEPSRVETILQTSRKALLDVRVGRFKPHKDDKVITAWNGLMISAFAKGYAVLGNEEYLQVYFFEKIF